MLWEYKAYFSPLLPEEKFLEGKDKSGISICTDLYTVSVCLHSLLALVLPTAMGIL